MYQSEILFLSMQPPRIVTIALTNFDIRSIGFLLLILLHLCCTRSNGIAFKELKFEALLRTETCRVHIFGK